LCGQCLDGYVEAVGSVACVPVTQCDSDVVLLWPLFVVGIMIAAALQLAVVSDVWCPSRSFPRGKVKLMIYFFQVRDGSVCARVFLLHVHVVCSCIYPNFIHAFLHFLVTLYTIG
jgi:hypothetical protein